MPRVRVALCQLDTVVGDIDGNVERILAALARAEEDGADIAAFPELAVTGYPPEDLLAEARLRGRQPGGPATGGGGHRGMRGPGGIRRRRGTRQRLRRRGPRRRGRQSWPGKQLSAAPRGGCATPWPSAPEETCSACTTSAGLPNYGVFDEERWFAPGTSELELYEVAGVPVGVSVCEDLWFAGGPIAVEAAGGARLIVNVNASPYAIGRGADRLAVARQRVAEAGCAIAYVNQVGGQDELVFDGGSFVVDRTGAVVAAAASFAETILTVDVDVPESVRRTGPRPGPRHAVVISLSSP